MLTPFQNRLYQDAKRIIPENPSVISPGNSVSKFSDSCLVYLHFSYEKYDKREAEYIGKLIEPLVSTYCEKHMKFRWLDEPSDNVPTVVRFWFYTEWRFSTRRVVLRHGGNSFVIINEVSLKMSLSLLGFIIIFVANYNIINKI